MVDPQIVTDWIAKAEEDYLFTEKHIVDEESFFAPLCFHCQQAAEKYLKAYIVAHELPLRKIHDLVELVKLCMQADSAFEELKGDAILINPYYIDTRYPATWPIGFTKDDALAALATAGRIREFVKEKLKKTL